MSGVHERRQQSSRSAVPRLLSLHGTRGLSSIASTSESQRAEAAGAASRRAATNDLPSRQASSASLMSPFSAARLRQEVSNRSPAIPPRQLQPEAIALPPSSSASAASAVSPSVSRRGTVGDESRQPEKQGQGHNRKVSQTDEAILREMRERLAAVGHSDGLRTRNTGRL